MKRQRPLHLFLLLTIVIAAAVLDLAARTVPGLDGYVVDLPARRLSNGIMQPARAFTITRPAANTIQRGVIYVSTKKSFGMIKGEQVLSTSTVNLDLQGLKVRDISLAMQPANAEATVTPEAVSSGLDRLYVIRYDEPLDPFDLCKRLMSNPDVEYATPARIHEMSFTPNDTRYNQQPFLSKIRVPQAWDITKGSADILIAIVDSGTDYLHEDLAANVWMNPGEIEGNGVDDDQNGYIDDVRGWDFVGNASAPEAQSGIYRPDNDPRHPGTTLSDAQAHGTVVAGNAAAVTNNSKGVAGIASNCKILCVKVGSDNSGAGGIYQGYPAIKYAADMGADVINCSWGGYGADPSAQGFVDYALAKGAVVVAAAGNNGLNMNTNFHAPACLDGVLSVGSVNSNDQPSYFSNYGYANVTYAPGENPLSTYPGNQYRGMSGTSFSSPVVAGVVALVRSVHPDWTPEQVMMQIRVTNDPVSGIPIVNKPLYFGRVNAERAVKTNASWSTGDRLPGVGLASYTVQGGNKITSFAETTIQLNFSNILADAQDVVVNAEIADSHIELLTSTELVLGDLARNATAAGTLKIKLKPNYPWFNGTVNVGLNIRTATTNNFAYVTIPVELPSSNTYEGSGPIDGIFFTQAVATEDQNLWGTGDLGGVGFLIRGKDQASASFNIIQLVPTALDALNANFGMIGAAPGGTAGIQTTNNGGASWGTTLTPFASTIDAIKIYDVNNAWCIGTGSGTKFGIGRTTNGGSTWTHFTAAPVMLSNEKVSPGSATSLRDCIWFGTTNGRVVRTLNRGVSWTVANPNLNGGVVHSLAFSDSARGVMLYSTTSAVGAPMRIASTQDGGATWTKNVFDPSTLGIEAAYVASPGTNHVLLVGSAGEVFGSDNLGTAWQPILSKPSGIIVTGEGLKLGTETGLLLAGSQVGILNYHYSGPNSSKILAFETQTTDYGVIDAGKFRLKYVKVINSGDGDALVEQVSIVPDAGTPSLAFTVSLNPGSIVQSKDDVQYGIRCTGTDTGTYGATMYVISNATPDTISVRLVAQVRTPVSVEDTDVHYTSVSAWPNPASDVLNVAMLPTVTLVTIIDARGNVVSTTEVPAGTVMQRMSIGNLPSGVYRVLATSPSGVESVQFVVAR